MKCNFSFNHYRHILKVALGDNFALTSFRDFEKNKKNSKIIILRHDIDYSPKKALTLAKIENKLGIKSTFFVRVHGEYYHPFDRNNFPVLIQIKEMGHEIGLHTEAKNLSKIFKVDMMKIFLKEKEILEDIFDIQVESAAEHADLDAPKNFWQDHFFSQVKKIQVGIAHFPQEYQEFRYISDSRRSWQNGCLCRNLGRYEKIQLLVHPDLWGEGALEEIDTFIKSNPAIKSKKKYNFASK